MIQQVKLIYKKSYDDLEDTINAFLKDTSNQDPRVDTIINGNDSNIIAVITYMKNPM